MGMASSDDEARIMEDRELLDWAREAPQGPSYDQPMSEEEKIQHDRAAQEHYDRRPTRRNPYENDRR